MTASARGQGWEKSLAPRSFSRASRLSKRKQSNVYVQAVCTQAPGRCSVQTVLQQKNQKQSRVPKNISPPLSYVLQKPKSCSPTTSWRLNGTRMSLSDRISSYSWEKSPLLPLHREMFHQRRFDMFQLSMVFTHRKLKPKNGRLHFYTTFEAASIIVLVKLTKATSTQFRIDMCQKGSGREGVYWS